MRIIYQTGPTPPSQTCKNLFRDLRVLKTSLEGYEKQENLWKIKKDDAVFHRNDLQRRKVEILNRECNIGNTVFYLESIEKRKQLYEKFSSFPCYFIPLVCPGTSFEIAENEANIKVLELCVYFLKNIYVEKLIKEQEKQSKNYNEAVREEEFYKGYVTATKAEIKDKEQEIKDNNCGKELKYYQARIKSVECNKSKEIIRKLKNKYFKLSKDMLDIKLGLNGIKFLKLNQKYLIETKPIIEEVIKKGEDIKRYVVGTEDEAQFFIITSKVKSMLAQNIKEQSLFEANLKNLLIKKEKTNVSLKRTKKLLDLKIKQSIKFCN